MKTAQEYARLILDAIHEDMKQPLPWGAQIPRDVGSFIALQEYLDANGYISDALNADLDDRPCSDYEAMRLNEEYDALWNAVASLVDAQLARAMEPEYDDITSGYPEPFVIRHGDDVHQPEDDIPVIREKIIQRGNDS